MRNSRKKRVTTIAENDNSAERSTHGSTSGNPTFLVGRQDALATAARAQGGEQATETADVTAAEAQPAGEVEDGKLMKAKGTMVDTAAKKAEDEAGEKAEITRAQKAEIKVDKDAAAAKKTAETVEQAAKKQLLQQLWQPVTELCTSAGGLHSSASTTPVNQVKTDLGCHSIEERLWCLLSC